MKQDIACLSGDQKQDTACLSYEEAALRNWATESPSAKSLLAMSPSDYDPDYDMKSDLLRALEHMNAIEVLAAKAIVLVQSDQVT